MRALPTLVALAVLAAFTGCGPAGAPAITRRLGGEARRGIFVSPFSYEHFLRGELAYARGDLQEARQEYELARAGPEDDPLLIARLADVLDRLGREREALALLDEGERLDRRSELVWLARGRIHERHARMDDAADAYAQAIAVAPRSEQGPLALAALLRSQGKSAEADAVLERYLARNRGAGAARARLALAVEQGRAQAAADAVRALLEVAPARSDEVRRAAVTALEAGEPEIALRLLAALPETDADRELRLRAAIEAGDRTRAENLLATWMPESPEQLVAIARGYLVIGMPARARELAQVAVASEGGTPATLVLGRALRAEGRLAEAAAVLASIGPASGAWPEGPVELAATLRAAGRPALAAETLARADALRPDAALALALSEARMEAGDVRGALAALERDEARIRAARARLLERLGRVDEAATIYAALAPDDPTLDARDRARTRIESAWQAGDRDAALAALAEWSARAPEDLLARARHAELLAAIGRLPEAREVAGEALPLAVDSPLRRRLTALVTASAAPRATSRRPSGPASR